MKAHLLAAGIPQQQRDLSRPQPQARRSGRRSAWVRAAQRAYQRLDTASPQPAAGATGAAERAERARRRKQLRRIVGGRVASGGRRAGGVEGVASGGRRGGGVEVITEAAVEPTQVKHAAVAGADAAAAHRARGAAGKASIAVQSVRRRVEVAVALRRAAGRGGRGAAGVVLEAASGAVGAGAGDGKRAAQVRLGARRAAGGAQLERAVRKLGWV